jgi:hypothetical protein
VNRPVQLYMEKARGATVAICTTPPHQGEIVRPSSARRYRLLEDADRRGLEQLIDPLCRPSSARALPGKKGPQRLGCSLRYRTALYRRSGSICFRSTFAVFFALAALRARVGSKLRLMSVSSV